jgi:hypothetical protein
MLTHNVVESVLLSSEHGDGDSDDGDEDGDGDDGSASKIPSKAPALAKRNCYVTLL